MNQLTPIDQLPSLSQKIFNLLGFKVTFPVIAIPQTVKNLDKALARIIEASGENIAARLERNTAPIQGDSQLSLAKSQARVELVQQASKHIARELNDDSEQVQRAIQYAVGEGILKQANRETIVKIAVQEMEANISDVDATEEIDSDWLNTFSELSGRKSNAQIQILWGKILAGEIRQPSTFSIRSLNILACMDHMDAMLAHKILSDTMNKSYIYSGEKNSISEYVECEALGIISGVAGNLSVPIVIAAESETHFFLNKTLIFGNNLDKNPKHLQVPIYRLTAFGRQLYKLSNNYIEDDNRLKLFIQFLKTSGLLVSTNVEWTWNSENNIMYDKHKSIQL